jgi:hypothetical protein
MSASPEEIIVEPSQTEPTPTPKNGGALFDFITGKQPVNPQDAVLKTETDIVTAKTAIQTIENEIKTKQLELLNKRTELGHLETDLKRQKGNIGAVLYTKGGKKSKKSHKKSHKKSSRKTR